MISVQFPLIIKCQEVKFGKVQSAASRNSYLYSPLESQLEFRTFIFCSPAYSR